MSDHILVTGVTGFIAAHITHKLLDQGYKVRGTARNAAKAQKIVETLKAQGANTGLRYIKGRNDTLRNFHRTFR